MRLLRFGRLQPRKDCALPVLSISRPTAQQCSVARFPHTVAGVVQKAARTYETPAPTQPHPAAQSQQKGLPEGIRSRPRRRTVAGQFLIVFLSWHPSGGFQLLTAPDDIHFRPDLMTPRLRQIPTVRNVSGRRKSSTSSHERYGFESAVYRFLETCSGGNFVV